MTKIIFNDYGVAKNYEKHLEKNKTFRRNLDIDYDGNFSFSPHNRIRCIYIYEFSRSMDGAYNRKFNQNSNKKRKRHICNFIFPNFYNKLFSNI